MLNVCFCLQADDSFAYTTTKLEQDYQFIYKPFLTFLHKTPNIYFTFAFTGAQFDYYVVKHSEFSDILKDLLKRHQIEILTGGYYNPIMPLLCAKDRNAQIEKLSSSIKLHTGHRSYGMYLCGSVWSVSLIPTLCTCLVKYVLLDHSALPKAKCNFLPINVAEQNKSIAIFPTYKNFAGCYAFDAIATLDCVSNFVKLNTDPALNINRTIVLSLTKELLQEAFEEGWFISLSHEKFNSKSPYKIALPSSILKATKLYEKAYIPYSIDCDIAQWGSVPYKKVSPVSITVQDMLAVYPRQQALQDRCAYLSLLSLQCKDKGRRKVINDKVLSCQTGYAYLCTARGRFISYECRQKLYKQFCEIESTIRDSIHFTESMTAFDYDNDGKKEYLCQMQTFNACIDLKGAVIRELSVLPQVCNYTDCDTRIQDFDGFNDNYTRGFFSDHFICPEDFNSYCSQQHNAQGQVFLYEATSFVPLKRELRMEAIAYFGSKAQKIRIRKLYLLNSSAVQVQYIITNESENTIQAQLCVESNFTGAIMQGTNHPTYKVEVPGDGKLKLLDTGGGIMSKAFAAQITDTINLMEFIFEPNENATFVCYPLPIKRPQEDGKLNIFQTILVTAICWNIKLEKGGETEKTINLTIKPAKLSKDNSKS